MKNKKLQKVYKWYVICSLVLAPIVIFVIYPKYYKYQLENAPKLDFEHAIESTLVEKIDFGRSGFKINGLKYNAFGISAYAKIHNESESFDLYKLPPPFILSKEANNDTLKIIKDDKQYYLLISEERQLW